MTFYQITAGAMRRKRLLTSLTTREGKASGTSRRAHTSTSADRRSFISFHDSRDRRPARETFIRRNGRDRTRSSRSRITAARGELSAGGAASIPNASEIVSRRDRNYLSQSLVGNISAGWHAKTRTDVYRPMNGWRGAQEILISGYRMHLSSYAPRGAAAGDCRSFVSGRAIGTLQRGDTYLLAWALITLLAVGYHWDQEYYPDRYIRPYYSN